MISLLALFRLKSRWGIELGDVKIMIGVRKIRGKVPYYNGDGTITITRHWFEEKSYLPAQLVVAVSTF